MDPIRPGNRNIVLPLAAILTIFGQISTFATPAGSDTTAEPKQEKSSTSGDFAPAQTWSIVPAGSDTELAKPVRSSGNAAAAAPRKIEATAQTSKTEADANISTKPAETKTLKLYGRIEELCNISGAKIPLKMQAMTPIRDTSLDGKVASKDFKIKDLKLSARTNWNFMSQTAERSYPIDYRGTWSGEMTVYLVDFDSSYFDFDPEEAEKQQQLIKTGTQGTCSVTFYEGSDNKVELQPTQIVFSTMVNAAEQMKHMANSPLAALFGGAKLADNPMLANLQVPYQFAIPLGNMSSATGVTGNQLGSELMKNTLKELAKGVLEQQVVTRDSDRNSSGQVKNTFTESDLRFTRMNESRLFLQAASVSYDSQGNYLNKIVLKGILDKGAVADNSGQSGSSSLFGNSPLFGGADSGTGGAGSNTADQLQQLQKMLQEMGGQ